MPVGTGAPNKRMRTGVLLFVYSFHLFVWGPVTGREKAPSLVDPAGYFYYFEAMPVLLTQAKLDQLEVEFRLAKEYELALHAIGRYRKSVEERDKRRPGRPPPRRRCAGRC